jgi:hypothetical protein
MIFKIPIIVVELEPDSFHLFIKAKLNGKTVNLLLDTGASKSVFDINRIANFIGKQKNKFESFEKQTTGLGTNTMESHFTVVKSFCIGEIEVKEYKAILLDMSHINQSYELLQQPFVDGVLGSDFLMRYHAVIDYKKRMLKLSE